MKQFIPVLNPDKNFILQLLKFALLLQCTGVFFHLLGGSAIETMLFMEVGMKQADAKSVEKFIGWIFLFLGIWAFFKPNKPLLVIISIMTLLLAFIIKRQGGSPFTEWSIPAHMVRILLPIGILFFIGEKKKLTMPYYILLTGIVITFLTHGFEALSLHPRFLDYLILSFDHILGLRIRQIHAENMLRIIGSMDIIVAILAIFFPKKPVFIWLAFWGLLTAFARVTELGIGMYPEVLIRAGHFLVPVALILINEKITNC
ncbi:hypothetical protein EF405_03880 [Cyclobacteriaceae bacterium YHN15]|nr:hypothetical protein EF405_03880 [Cyclobacteriaceae bacterium YHN15]